MIQHRNDLLRIAKLRL